MTYVSIVTSDRGWILERLATEIVSRHPYVVLANAPDPKADLNYYMTYSSWRKPASALEMAYFAHLEPSPDASSQFFNVAANVDYCVCHSSRYEKILNEHGIATVATISPGIDLERFVPRVKIGVVGRTYHTGRKGEHLVAAVMDIPGLDWHFTGGGWPLPGRHIPEADLPAFYRSMDYILVSSLYEGGPMCVAEALACGTPVIGPDVGWVHEFPHIPFKVGDAADLRRVLLEVVKQKEDLRSSVIERTWEAWADGHHKIFERLLGAKLSEPQKARAPAYRSRVGLVLHGSEGTSPGGPTVRVPRLAEELRMRGSEVSVGFSRSIDFARQDLLHYFNVWGAESALSAIRYGKSTGAPVVFSPIFLDLSGAKYWQEEIPQLFADGLRGKDADLVLARLKKQDRLFREQGHPPKEVHNGFHGMVRDMLAHSDHVIFLSDFERRKLEAIGAVAQHSSLVHNPISATLWQGADPSLFRDAYGLSDYVLCVARLEPRKNQLMLLHALRDLDLPIALVGHQPSPTYLKRLREIAGPNVFFIERLDPNSPMLASAMAGARVFVLPSWAEGAPLSALEAAAAGIKLVLSEASGEREYLADRALYCDPGDPASIRATVLEAYDADWPAESRRDQSAFISDRFSWSRHVDATQAAYSDVLARRKTITRQSPPEGKAGGADEATSPPSIVLDVTTSANRVGRWTGIARVEMALAKALLELGVDPMFVAWNDALRRFVRVPAEVLDPALLAPYVSSRSAEADRSVPAIGSHFVVAGSGWMQSSVYPAALTEYSSRHAMVLCLFIFDIIPTKFPYWFAPEYAPVFVKNLATILRSCDVLLTSSASTKRDLLDFAKRKTIAIPSIEPIRLGDEIESPTELWNGQENALSHVLAGKPFVMSVGAIHKRKNQAMLCDLWAELRATMGARCPTLVIVGGVAWNGDDVARRIKEDERLAGIVQILDDVDDEGLEWLYRECLFTVYPSLYEGWGLPVGESLRHGKICIAASVSSIPEIAPDITDLVDPLDFTSWLAKLRFYAGSAEARVAREKVITAGYRSRGWDLVAGDLVSAIGTKVRRTREYPLGTVINFADAEASSGFVRTGWHPVERWGRWTAEDKATLEVALATPSSGPLTLVAWINNLGQADGGVVACNIACNGRIVAKWTMQRSGLQLRTACIPRDCVGDGTVLRLEFLNGERRSPQGTGPKADRRLLGLGLAKLAILEDDNSTPIATYFDPAKPTPGTTALEQSYRFTNAKQAEAFTQRSSCVNAGWGIHGAGHSTELILHVVEQPQSDVVCELEVRPVASETSPVHVKIFANGTLVETARFVSDEIHLVSLEITAGLRAKAQPITIEFVGKAGGSPKSLGIGSSATKFAVGIVGLRVTSAREEKIPFYLEGETIEFGEGRAGVDWLGCGWHNPEAPAVWSRSARASLRFMLDDEVRPGLLIFRTAPVPYSVRSGPSSFCLNGIELLPVFDGTSRVFHIPEGSLAYSNVLDVVTPKTESPFAAAGVPDERRLGTSLSSLMMVEPPLLDWERRSVFLPSAQTSFRADWPLEALDAADAVIVFRVGRIGPSKDMPISILMSVSDVVRLDGLVVTASLCSRVLSTWSVDDTTPVERSFAIPVEDMVPGQLLIVRIRASLRDEEQGVPCRLVFGQIVVNGSAHDIEATSDATSEGVAPVQPPAVPAIGVDEPLVFSVGANGVGALREGWHQVEPSGAWSQDGLATMAFMLGTFDELAELDLTYRVIGTDREHAELSLGLNGVVLHRETVESDDVRVATVKLLARPGIEDVPATFELTVSRLFSPEELSLSADQRRLGVMVISAALRMCSAPGAEPEAIAETEPVPEAELEADTTTDPVPAAEPEAVAETAPEADTATEPVPEAEPESKAAPEAGLELAPDPVETMAKAG